jgi:long-subunit fatty acid transport protein
MKNLATTAVLLASTAGAAYAGGIERANESVLFMFEEGNYAELAFGVVSPSVSGHVTGAPSVASGDMTSNYNVGALSYKSQLNDNWHLGIKVEHAQGADLDYGAASVGYPLQNASAEVDVNAVTAIVRYQTDSNLSAFGGLRIQRAKGTVDLGVAGYTMVTTSETDTGYLLGVAWERPEIAARVALTYHSAITHDFSSTEQGFVPGEFSTTTPQAVNLEFQTGIAADTLLFGNIRWVDWTAFDISPPNYPGNPLVSYDSDTITYNVGVGRKFSETWSGAVTLGYEAPTGDIAGNLGPTDGQTSIGLAASYTRDAMKVTFGVRYVDIGDATTSFATFEDNSAIAAGVRIGYYF